MRCIFRVYCFEKKLLQKNKPLHNRRTSVRRFLIGKSILFTLSFYGRRVWGLLRAPRSSNRDLVLTDGCLETHLEAGSYLAETYTDSQRYFYNHYPYYMYDKDPIANPQLFPCKKGTIIDEFVIKQIHEWEEQCRSLGDVTIIHPQYCT